MGRVSSTVAKILAGVYAPIGGTISTFGTFLRIPYECVVGGLEKLFQYPRRIKEILEIMESLGKDNNREESKAPNPLLYTASKGFGNIVDSLVGYLVFGPYGAALGGLSMINAGMADLGNLLKIIMYLRKKVGEKLGLPYPLRVENSVESYLRKVSWVYQIIDKTFGLLNRRMREWLKSIYPELNKNKSSFENLVNYYYKMIKEGRLKITEDIKKKLEKALEDVKVEGDESYRLAYAIARLQMYRKLDDVMKVDKKKELLAYAIAGALTPAYIVYRWLKGSIANIIEYIRLAKSMGMRGIAKEVASRYVTAYRKAEEKLEKIFNKIGEVSNRVTSLFSCLHYAS